MAIKKSEQQTVSTSMNRRSFLQAAGIGAGLVVTFSSRVGAAGGGSTSPMPEANLQSSPASAPVYLDSFIRLNEDGTVTVMNGKIEFGQGIQTGFGQLVAEELSIPFESVEVIHGHTNIVPVDGPTAGSGSTRRTGVRIRQAAAEMREWLIELGAAELGVDAADVVVADGTIAVAGTPGNAIAFADLAAGKSAERELRDDVPLKDPADYTVVGQSIPRVDVPFKVNGEMIYGIDASVEGMVYGKIVRPPARGATLDTIDFSAAETMPGVIGTFRDGDFAGLAAERLQQAESALAAVKATWILPETTTTHETIFDLLRATPDDGQVMGVEEGEIPPDPEGALEATSIRHKATFKSPYVSHSPIEPKSSLASVTSEGVEIWTSTQHPFGVRTAVATLLGLEEEAVVVNALMGGGAFGSKVMPDSEIEAVRLPSEFGRPVKIIWTRKEEFQDARFRPAMLIDIEAGLDESGALAAWKYDLYSSAYFPEGAEEPTSCAAAQAAPADEVYDIPVSLTTWYQCDSPLPPYFWRVNGAATNTFAREVVIDELAELAGVDPVTFRNRMLGNNPRQKAVMDAVIEKAGWTPGVGQTGQGIGIAIGFDTASWVAEVARVEVDEETGVIKVLHVDAAVDCGLVINPLAVLQQAEGSIVMGLSPTLREMTTFENGRVTNASFGQYRPITMMESPTVDLVFVEDKSQPFGGIGEPFVSPVPAAVSNAVYDAIGIRLHEMPFTPDRVLAAIAAKKAE